MYTLKLSKEKALQKVSNRDAQLWEIMEIVHPPSNKGNKNVTEKGIEKKIKLEESRRKASKGTDIFQSHVIK